MANASIETRFFKACVSGDMDKVIKLLIEIDLTKLIGMKTEEGSTCLHLAVLAGNPGLVKKFKKQEFINEQDNQGDTALHLAVRKYRVDLVTLLFDPKADCKADLSVENKMGETPLCIAVKFGLLDVTEKLIKHGKEAVQKICKEKKVLHLAVELNRIQIVELLKRSEIINELINQRVDGSRQKPSDNDGKPDEETVNSQPIVGVEGSRQKPSDNDGKPDKESVNSQPIAVVEGSRPKPSNNDGKSDKETVNSKPIVGDTALHIAAKNKSEHIVDLLLKVPGVNKHALNSEGKTPLDVAREVTDYHETFRRIKKLTDYPRNLKPFMYCAPAVSQEKHKRAMEAVDKAFDERRNAELVVAALLATMTFTAVFTVPGGSYGDSNRENKGTPVFLGYYMFKLFIIFDCIAFFLSLFVCIMWQLAPRLTTEDKILFMSVSGFLTCFSLGYTACGFMAAVYTIIAHKDEILAWVILGNLLLIAFCGFIAFIHQSAILLVARARFHRLCGIPRRVDKGVEAVWKRAEHSGFLTIIRCLDNLSHDAVEGDEQEHLDKTSHDAVEGVEHEHGYNCSCSSSPCLRNISQSV